MTPQKWGVIFNYIFPKTLLIRLAVKRSKGSILYNISKEVKNMRRNTITTSAAATDECERQEMLLVGES